MKMKKIVLILSSVSMLIFLNSCGINMSSIVNHNLNNTQVQLSNNNFKVVDKISGSSEVSYVLIFGGINKKQLYENAYSAMVNKANLTTGSRALINIVTEEHIGGVPPFYYTRTVTVSAHVIEFTK
jgi:hypothetical protein